MFICTRQLIQSSLRKEKGKALVVSAIGLGSCPLDTVQALDFDASHFAGGIDVSAAGQIPIKAAQASARRNVNTGRSLVLFMAHERAVRDHIDLTRTLMPRRRVRAFEVLEREVVLRS